MKKYHTYLRNFQLGFVIMALCQLFILAGIPRYNYVCAATDHFTTLEKLVIGDVFSEDLKKLGSKVVNPQDVGSGVEVYTFESSFYSHPHFVNIENGKIIFLQLAIPAEQYKQYNTIFASLGTPETTLNKTHSEIVYAYPSKGTAFIVNGITSQVVRLQKFPVKKPYEYANDEGKNFKPKDYLPTLPPPYEQKVPYKNAWSIDGLQQRVSPLFGWLPKPLQYILFLAIVVGIIGSAIFLVRYLKRGKQENPPIPDSPEDLPKPGNPQ